MIYRIIEIGAGVLMDVAEPSLVNWCRRNGSINEWCYRLSQISSIFELICKLKDWIIAHEKIRHFINLFDS